MAFPDDIGNDLTFIILMFFLDFFFLGDIVINFITAQKDQHEKILDNIKIIAAKYLQSWFFVDLISIFPFDLIIQDAFPPNSVNISKYNKLFRIFRIGKLYRLIKVVKLIQ